MAFAGRTDLIHNDGVQRMSERREAEELRMAAEYVLSQSKLAQQVPAKVRRAIDKVLRKHSSQRPSLTEVWKKMRMKERFGVTRKDFRIYARQRHLADHPEMCKPAVVGLAALLSVPVGRRDCLGHKAEALAQARLAEVLCREDLSPEQLAKLLDAAVKGQAVALKKDAQTFAQKASRRAERRAKGDGLTLEERVRRIYGFDAPPVKGGGDGHGSKLG